MTGVDTSRTVTPRAVVSPSEPSDSIFAAAAMADAMLGMMTRAATVTFMAPASRRRRFLSSSDRRVLAVTVSSISAVETFMKLAKLCE